MTNRLSLSSLRRGVRELRARDQDLSAIVSALGPPPLWEREQGFPTLIQIILEQQVSLSSARAAFNRLRAVVPLLTPDHFLRLSDHELKAVGFSRQKTAYGRALAQSMIEGSLDLSTLDSLDDDEAKARLMRVKGIGQWTAEIYLLMALGRPDIWPSGDLALSTAVQRLKRWPRRVQPRELADLSQAWRPWRAVAARLLWHYYLSDPTRVRVHASSTQDRPTEM